MDVKFKYEKGNVIGFWKMKDLEKEMISSYNEENKIKENKIK